MTLFAQPTYEHTFSESANIAFLDKLGEVYYTMDVISKQCLIYDMDHTLLKSIALPTPEGYYLSDIQYLSENLFNQDDLVELVYIYSKYVPTDFSYYYTFETRLINENGVDLLTLPSGSGFTTVIETPSSGKKFLVYDYDYSVIPYRTSTNVYSLPETGTKSVTRSLTKLEGPAWPNPASGQVNIPVTLPEGVHSGSLEILDIHGRSILSYPLTNTSGTVVVPTSQLHSGTYLYQVHTGEHTSEVKKIIIR
jgi:hypothetical protein